ncbi:MAG: hypothetical protein ACTTKH_02905 [Treponema sp.]
MKVFIDENELDYVIENEKTIGEVLGNVEDYCMKSNATVTTVIVDGEVIPANKLDAVFLKPISDVELIELFTISGNEVRQNLAKLGGDFVILAENLTNIAILLNEGNEEKALSIIQEFSIMLKDLYMLYSLFDIADIGYDFMFEGKTIANYKEEFSSLLMNIVEGFEQKDTVAISDIAEYELSPLVLALGKGLKQLVQ